MHVLKHSLMIPLLMRGGAVWQLVGLITRRSQVQILPPLPSKECAFEVLLRRRFSLGWSTFCSVEPCSTVPPASGHAPRWGKGFRGRQALHQRGAAAIISGLGSTPEGGLPTGDPVRKEGSQHAYAARCNRNPVTGVFPEKGPSGPFVVSGASCFHAGQGRHPTIEIKAGCERQGNRHRESARPDRCVAGPGAAGR